MKDGRPKRGMDRDLALKVLALCSAVKDALDDLLGTMFIIYQPKSVEASIGDYATVSVVAMNVASYQWQYSQDGGTTWKNSGASVPKTASITIEVTASVFDLLRRCQLTDAEGNKIYTDVFVITEATEPEGG